MIQMGSIVEWQGYEFTVVGSTPYEWVLYSEVHKPDSALLVPKNEVQPKRKIHIGDYVASKLGPFQGQVTAIEPDGRLVCKSIHKPREDRTRYSYHHSELVVTHKAV